ncbi:MAG: hypothetical protein ACJA1L_000105 [Paracoccaceae bacterium]
MVGAASWPLMMARIARGRARGRGDAPDRAALYGRLTMLAKPFELRGALRYLIARARGERGRIIEYKAPEGAETPS